LGQLSKGQVALIYRPPDGKTTVELRIYLTEVDLLPKGGFEYYVMTTPKGVLQVAGYRLFFAATILAIFAKYLMHSGQTWVDVMTLLFVFCKSIAKRSGDGKL